MRPKAKFKQTEIGMIPEDWEVAELNEVTAFQYGLAESAENSGEYVYIRITDIDTDGSLIRGGLKYINENKVRETHRLKKNDVLVARTGASYGKTYIFNENFKATYGGFLIRLLFNERVKPKFYFQFARSKLYWNQANNLVGGGAQPQFNANIIKKIRIPIPPITEQKTITKIFSDLDEKVETNRKMNEILEELGQTLFKRWFVDFEFPNEKGKPYKSSGGEMTESELGEIPKGWKVSEMGEKLKAMLGGTPAREKKGFWTGGTIGWINSGAINDFPIIKPSEMITEEAVKKSATKLMPIKTVVLPFVISLDKEIKISILGFSTCGNQSVIGIIENKKIPAEYIYYWVKYMKKDIYSWATGGAQQHINQKVVVDTPILIPDDQTMNKYKTILRSVFDKIINNAHEILSLEQIRDNLLPKLMAGKVRVKK